MKYPSISKQPTRTINIPAISGGLNLRDGITAINDNQLTDGKNIWFKDNLLKTRPGLKYECALAPDGFEPEIDYGQETAESPQNENAVKVSGGERFSLISQRTNYCNTADGTELFPVQTHIRFFWIGKQYGITKAQELPAITSEAETAFTNHFVIQNKTVLYCFCETEDGGEIYKLENDAEKWAKLTDEDMYKPIIATHCTAGSSVIKGTPLGTGGTAVEGFNLLGGYYRLIYSTVNRAGLAEAKKNGDSDYHFMIYYLAESIRSKTELAGKTVTAKITASNGTVYTHTVTLNGSSIPAYEETAQGDGLRMRVFDTVVSFHKTENGEETIAKVTESDYVEDNMEITAPGTNSKENLKKVFAMKKQIWFGGDAAGISGGTRIFLGANAEEKEKSLVLWSGLNNPLYFPENCYAYVGNANQAVTAFGRQSDMLVIFKERETFLTQYTRNSDIKAADLINQSVVDYTASSVYFPMIQLHAGIGCDCPDTVQLCRNRLIWACTDGNVYTLVSENQYNERTIFKVSGMVSRRLKREITVRAASADFDGRYFLFIGDKVYVMEYESYGYTYISSYNKTEDAQLRIPWWYWELPERAVCVLENSGRLGVLTEDGQSFPLYFFGDGETTDEAKGGNRELPIKTFLQTKIFDFGAPAYTKNVPLVNIAFGNNGGEPVTVSFVSESGDCGDEEVTLSESAGDEYSPEFVHNRQLRPTAHTVTRFGVRIECDGVMSVDAISLNYRLLGGARY